MFKEQFSKARSGANSGVPQSKMDDESYQDYINNLLDRLPTQARKIETLYDEGWSVKQMQDVLRTAGGKVTPVQHINQVLSKYRPNRPATPTPTPVVNASTDETNKTETKTDEDGDCDGEADEDGDHDADDEVQDVLEELTSGSQLRKRH
jgi:hypothetical protein